MDKVYARINWENEPSIRTPINEINLNKMDYAVDELDNRVIELDNTKAPKSDMLLSVKGVSYNTETGVFTFTWWNGTTLNVDLNIEKIPVSFSMSETGIITMTTTDGTEYICDVASLIKAYIFEDSNQIAFTVNTSEDGIYHVTGKIKSGSITEEMLEPGILGKIANAQGYAEIASQKAENAEAYATLSKSYAVGGTGTREGEDADNAKYYAEQAKAVANIDIATTEKVGIVKPDGTSVTVDPDGTIHAQTGTNIEKLSDIGDVNIQNPQDKQALVYNSETQTWENGQGSVSPIDNLTSDSTTEPLSANQGRVLNNQKLQKEVISDEWNFSITYAVGQYCIHNNILWKCLVANTNTEPTEGTHWTKVSVANEITSLNSSLIEKNKWIEVLSASPLKNTTYTFSQSLDNFSSFAIGLEVPDGIRFFEFPIEYANGTKKLFISTNLGDTTTYYAGSLKTIVSKNDIVLSDTRINSFLYCNICVYGIK